MSKARAIFSAALGYVRTNPDEIVKVAVNAASGRFGVPLAALRYLASQAPSGKRMPKDIELGTAPPALRYYSRGAFHPLLPAASSTVPAG